MDYKIVPHSAENKSRDKCELFYSPKFYLLCHGCCVLLLFAFFAYTNATISTLEKRFHIPSQNSGFIVSAFDTASIFAPFLGYFIAKRHRPKWLSLIIFMMAVCGFQNALLHVFYGPGQDALLLTREYSGSQVNRTYYSDSSENVLCHAVGSNELKIGREEDLTDFFPQIYLYVNQVFGGIFGAVHDSIGVSYMDDNVTKTKMPMYLSVLQALRVVAPLLGFNLATVTLSQYIAPNLTPTIDENDTRWLGAWWMGWIVLGTAMLVFSAIISRFPKSLTKKDQIKEKLIYEIKDSGMLATFSRIFRNKIYIFNIISIVGNFLGTLPYWIYTAKYIEVQYKISASESSFLFGTIVQGAGALGTLLSGYIIYKTKPSARRLALFNILIAIVTSLLIYTYTFFDCQANGSPLNVCIPDCECDDVKYNPICGDNGNTYVSPCHAGCTNIENNNSILYYTNCTCVADNGGAFSGSCPVDCSHSLNLFLLFMSISAFISSIPKTNIFLFAMRAVDAADKTVALGAMITMISYFSFIPSSIIYGWIIDQTCIFWDNSSAGTGNCWRYDEDAFRFNFNVTAIAFLLLGALFGDGGLWFYVKNIKLFDDVDEHELNEDKSFKDMIL